MYPIILMVHNLLRWIVLALAILAVTRSLSAWFGKRAWNNIDSQISTAFIVASGVQFLAGIALYVFFSPITKVAFSDFGAAMGNNGIRFFAVEHTFLMTAAIVIAYIGNVRAKKATDAIGRHRQTAIWYAVALVGFLVAIPWWRPLLQIPL